MICPKFMSMLLTWAIKMAARASYSAVPSMLIVAPTGSTNRVTRLSTLLFSSRHLKVTGRVAELGDGKCKSETIAQYSWFRQLDVGLTWKRCREPWWGPAANPWWRWRGFSGWWRSTTSVEWSCRVSWGRLSLLSYTCRVDRPSQWCHPSPRFFQQSERGYQ